MLLSSSMPYYGKDRVHVIKRILNNKYHFKARRWKSVSDDAKAFVQQLLVSEPDERADAETALGSAWLNRMRADGAISSAEEEGMARSAMLRYVEYPKLKKMVSQTKRESRLTKGLYCLLIHCSPRNPRHSWSWLTSRAVTRLVHCASCLKNTTRGMTDPSGSKIFARP